MKTFLFFDPEMELFIKKYRIATGKGTHTSIIPPGNYHIPPEKLDTFYQLYREEVKTGKLYYFTEKPEVFGSPFKLDLDIKQDSSERRYNNNNFLLELIKHWTKEIFKFLKFKKEPLTSFEVILLEKEEPCPTKNDKEFKDGFHLIIPKLVAPYPVQFHIRERLLKKPSLIKLLREFRATNSPDDIFDKAVIQQNNWLLYLSRSKPPPYGGLYQMTAVYSIILKDDAQSVKEIRIILGEQIKIKELFQIQEKWEFIKHLSIRNKALNLEYLSEEIYHQIEGVERPQEGSPELPTEVSPTNLELIKELVKLLTPSRAENYQTWIEVGWCLSNISSQLFPLWVEFSQKAPNQFNKPGNQRLMEIEWARAIQKQRCQETENVFLKQGSLYYWAKQDNPEGYKELLNRQAFERFERSSIGDVDVAQLVKYLYPFEFVFVPSQATTGGIWYYFQEHHWHPERRGTKIREIVHTELHGHFIKIKDKYLRMAQELPEEQEIKKNTYCNYAKRMLEIAKSLRTTTKLTKITTEAEHLYKNESFNNILDRNSYLLGFPNGIYDATTFSFRNGKPNDFVSLTTSVPYIPLAELDSDLIQQVEKFYNDILPNQETREYYLKLQASTLDNFNREEKFYILTGEGRNGKSKSNELITKILGSYACSLSIQIITQKRGAAGQASPEIAKMDKKRYGYFKEVDDISEKVLNTGVIKDLTGNDVISARKLYENDNEFKVSLILVLMTNTLPDVGCDDNATWDRIRVIHFPITFKEDPDPTNPLEKKIDRSISERLESWKAPFMSLLVNKYYPLYRQTGLKAPEEVKKETEKYRIQNDTFLEFFNEKFKKEAKTQLTVEEIYGIFRQWFPNNYPHRAVYPKKELIHALKKKYKKEFKGEKILQGYTITEISGGMITEDSDELTR